MRGESVNMHNILFAILMMFIAASCSKKSASKIEGSGSYIAELDINVSGTQLVINQETPISVKVKYKTGQELDATPEANLKSSDESIIKLTERSGSYFLTPVAAGSAEVTANFKNSKATYKVLVVDKDKADKKPSAVTITPSAKTIAVGLSVSLVAKA